MKPSDQQVQDARRELRDILTRRDFLAAAGVGALGLAGCSSGGGPTAPVVTNPPPPVTPSGPTIPSGYSAITGTVVLPAGSQLKLTDLSVDVMMQTVPVAGSAAFTVGITSDGPSLALLLDKSGNGVLMSMFDAGSASHAVSAHTTALALLFYATNAYLFPAANASRILTLLDTDPAVANLEAAIATAVAADPQAIANNAPSLGPAVTQAMQAIMGEASIAATRGRSAPAAAAAGPPTLMTLNSVAEQNGIVASLDTTALTVLLSNVKRRPCRAYVYEITTQVTGAAAVDVLPAKLVAGPFDIAPTESLNFTNAVRDFFTFFNGNSPWSPVNLPPIPLTLETGTDLTRYNVIVIAAALKSVAYDTWEPTFFRDAHYKDTAAATWSADAAALLRQILFTDILLPLMSFVLGYGLIKMARDQVAAVVAAAATVEKSTMDAIINGLQFGTMGDLKSGLATVVQNAYTSQLYTGFWTKEVKAVMDPARAQAIAAGEAAGVQATRATAARAMFAKLFAPLYAAGAALTAIDFGAVIYDLWNSDIGTLWEVLLIHQKLGLVPQSPRIPSGARAHFRVSAPANIPVGSYQFDWTQSSVFATLSAVGEANVGNKITTSQLAVDLITTGSDATPINVLVIGYDTRTGQRVEFGRDGTTLSFLLPAEILPSAAYLDKHEQRTFSVVVTGTLPSAGLKYQWTLTGTSGSIGTTNIVTTTVPNVNYIAAVPGTDFLHVDVVDAAGTLWASADAPITVAAAASINFTISGAWDPTKQPPDGSYAYTDGGATRELSPGGGGLDALFIAYDIAPSDSTIGVLFILTVPIGEAFRTGEVFTKVVVGVSQTAGQFAFALASNQADPANKDSAQWGPAGPGTFTLVNVGQLLDGTIVAQFSFSVSNGAGTISGTGVARWK